MKTGVCSLVLLVTVFVTGAVSVLADEGQQTIFVGSDGSVRFGNPVEYTPTGLSATSEALKYPEAVKRLIAEGRDFLPVKTKVAGGRMVGFITWRVVEETELGLARSADVLEVRPPADEAEKEWEEKEIANPFGLLAAASLVLLLLGNLVVTRRKDNLTAEAFTFTFAAAFAFVAFVALVAVGVNVGAALVAFVAFVAFAVAFAVAAGNVSVRPYRVSSGVAAILMATAVFLAI